MSTSTNSTTAPDSDGATSSGGSETPIVEEVYSGTDDDQQLIGYACQSVLTQNVVNEFELVFFIDIASRLGEQPFTVLHIQQLLVPAMGSRYGIADGYRCEQLPVDGSTWVVEFSIDPADFAEVDLFDGCRELSWDTTTQDCHFYEVTIRGSYMGAPQQDLPDVVSFIRQQFDSTALVQDLNDAALESGVDVVTDNGDYLYQTAFLGVLEPEDVTETGNGDDGRDNLNPPTNVEKEATQAPASDSDRTTITIVGGLLVAAFAFAFLAIMYILWRRRQHHIRSQQVHMSGLDKISVMAGDDNNNMNDYDDDGGRDGRGAASIHGLGELGPYNTSNTDLEEEDYDDMKYDDEHYDDKEHRMMMQSESRQGMDDVDVDNENSSARSPATNPMQFDLGSSLKDQLMGVYGGGNNSISKRSNGGLTGSVLFPAAYSVDGDSDADSWAQTDGTIGSLELQLEPITAEV